MIQLETTQPPAWNTVAPHPLVAWEWGDAREAMGIDVVRLGEYQDRELVDVCQITFHPLPHTNFTIGYAPRTRIPSHDMIQAIKEHAKVKRAVFVKFEPYVRAQDASADTNLKNFMSEVAHSTHPLFPKWTQMLDLQHTEGELFEALKPKWRYNIKLAQRKGVHVREMTTDHGFEIFSKLYFETTHRQEYAGHSKQYHEIVYRTLKENIGHILIAFYEDTPLSAYHLFLFNDVLYYPYGGSSVEHRNVMASNALMWEAIRFGVRHHAKTFDMWGSLSPDTLTDQSGWGGFTRFKEGYGTDFVEFIGSFDLVLNPVLYRVYNVADIVRKKFFL